MTKAQETYERIEHLVGEGVDRPDAFKQLAAEYGQPVNSIRGAYYNGRREVDGDSGTSRTRRSKKRETTAEDAIETAIGSMLISIDNIKAEVVASRERAREAVAEHKALADAAGPRISEIEAKIAMLRGVAPTSKEVRPVQT